MKDINAAKTLKVPLGALDERGEGAVSGSYETTR